MSSTPGTDEPPARRRIRDDYLSDPAHGPLPALLLALTVATGIIDAVSVLGLGRVFVANMTGNVVFTGFALAGAPGFALDATLSALAGFLVGALAGGRVITRWGAHRGKLLRNVTAVQLLLVLIALVITILAGSPLSAVIRDLVIVLTAIAFGLQNSAARRLAVPDITTTVLTMTLTGVAADLRSGNLRVALRRALAVLAMLVGAIVGALLVLHADIPIALGCAAVLIAVVMMTAALGSRTTAPWQAGRH
ncbi:MAG TPA: YoaK family protein [Pseudonocardiaceae bacterium]|jgi:uncharacterized membrane protein YoaK (UPF0700 family)|nr:YoaK family protein [Pseudonocardiaceae bacterium]